jgi:hypothetical protein
VAMAGNDLENHHSQHRQNEQACFAAMAEDDLETIVLSVV